MDRDQIQSTGLPNQICDPLHEYNMSPIPNYKYEGSY